MDKKDFLVSGIIKAKSKEEAKGIMRLRFPSFAIVELRKADYGFEMFRAKAPDWKELDRLEKTVKKHYRPKAIQLSYGDFNKKKMGRI